MPQPLLFRPSFGLAQQGAAGGRPVYAVCWRLPCVLEVALHAGGCPACWRLPSVLEAALCGEGCPVYPVCWKLPC
eukprot:359692-Chlamydomonas_euryale.AAC.3